MSKERARRRAEREAQAARLKQARARKTARRAWRGRMAALVPRPRPVGPAARRRRQRNAAVVALFLAVQGAAWLLGLSGTGRFAVFGLSLLITPVVVLLAFDRR